MQNRLDAVKENQANLEKQLSESRIAIEAEKVARLESVRVYVLIDHYTRSHLSALG